MLGDNLNIYKLEWLDIVFAGRNKEYGAYELRKNNPKNLRKALFYVLGVFFLVIIAPIVYDVILGIRITEEETYKQTDIELMPPPPIDKSTPPPPPPAAPPPPQVDQIKFPPPVVKPDEQVVEEEVPTVDELAKADPAQKTQEGDPNAEVNIDEPTGDGPIGAEITESEGVVDVAFVEQNPEFPGGQDAFAKHLQRNLRYPPLARENNIQGRVYVSFVVERDGSLSDIKIERGIGGGCDEEALRVLRITKGWKPGIQNGRPVRVKYTLPIIFQLSSD